MQMQLTRSPRIVVIGGGTGSFSLLSDLKNHTKHLTALVNMADSGGSSGVLRDELGVLPPGDIRQCLVALSTAPEELRSLFNFRFPEGTFAGHSFGNLFLSAVEKMTNNFEDAVRMASDVLRIKGQVLPITLTDCNLVMQAGGHKITGEYKIAYESFSSVDKPLLSLEPKADINPSARQAILDADMVVIAPGDLYSALACSLLVDGVTDSLMSTKAKIIYVCNLINKPNHTRDFAVHDYAAELERLAGAEILDMVLYNTDTPDAELINRYAHDGEFPVVIDESALAGAHYQAIGGQFLSRVEHAANPHDTLIKRSLIRHDGEAVAKTLLKLSNHYILSQQ